MPLKYNEEGLVSFSSYFVLGLLVGMILGGLIECFVNTGKAWVFIGVTSFFALGSGFWKGSFWEMVFQFLVALIF